MCSVVSFFFFFKQKTAYEMRISDWSSDVCSSDLGTEDGEGTLLEQIRAIAPELPIAVTLDLHCNLTPKMVGNCTALIGYKTYPHVDMDVEIGRASCRERVCQYV